MTHATPSASIKLTTNDVGLVDILPVYVNGRCIGHIPKAAARQLQLGDYSQLTLVHNWRVVFSTRLIAQLAGICPQMAGYHASSTIATSVSA